MSEYTLVFQRSAGRKTDKVGREWVVTRPAPERHRQAREVRSSDVAEVFAVPICSALALDGAAYERFLSTSGVLDQIVAILPRRSLRLVDDAETARKEIQALVMAAEVQHIVEGMSA